jgi:lysophospholipase L1-like esterase
MHYLILVLLSPILLFQGYLVRKRTPLLPEPEGDREGIIGNGPELRLLIVGDSAGAGVGASHQDEALSGQLVQNLSEHFRVQWRLHARTGATTHSTISSMAKLAGQEFDFVLISLGVNDITAGINLGKWRAQQKALRELLFKQHKARHIIHSGMPPVHGFPALNQPLRWFLGRRATEFDNDLKQQVKHLAGCHYLNLRFSEDRSMMASDGFHPGPRVYREWGKLAAERIKQLM